MRRWLLLPFALGFSLLAIVLVIAQEPTTQAGSRSVGSPVDISGCTPGLEVTNDSPTALGNVTTLTATVSVDDGFSYYWDLGDGSPATGSVVTHTYPEVGRYTAEVMSTNGTLTFIGTTTVTVDIPVATPLLDEGFEGIAFPPPGWSLSVLTDCDPWQQAGDQAHSGAYSAFHDDFVGMQDAWLVTPRVTPTVESQLVFWQFENYGDVGYYFKHSVWGSIESGDPKDGDFVELVELGPGTEETWEEVRMDLSGYAGQPIYLAFRYEGDFADEWHIDDVQVTVGLVVSHTGPKAPGEVVTLTADVATGSNVGYLWDLGGGVIRSGAVVTHAYDAPGDHTAVVTASNSVSMITETLVVPIRAFLYLPLALR